MKSSSLSNLTIQGIAASSGFDSASVSWPTRMWSFCSRSTRWGSSPNGLIPCGSPAAIVASQRCSASAAGQCSS